MALLVDDDLKLDIESYCGEKFDGPTWANVRQCVRCLTKGRRIKDRQLVPASPADDKVVRHILRDLGKQAQAQQKPFLELLRAAVTI